MNFLTFSVFLCLFITNVLSSKPVLENLPSQISKTEKSVVILSCLLSSGTLPIRFSWFFNSQKLSPNKNVLIENDSQYSVLKILNVQKEQNGNYSCYAENNLGNSLTSSRLFVKGFFFSKMFKIILRIKNI